jgi:hypothetical protein
MSDKTDTDILDDDWICNFEKNDKLYKDFYKDDVYFINLHIIYVNKNNEIEKLKQEIFLMSLPNYVTRNEVLGIIKKNLNDNNRNYSLFSILKYNINIDTEDIENFLKVSDLETYYDDFLFTVKNIDSIKFEKTINMFHDLNDLIFIFNEKSNEIKKGNSNITKKVILNANNKRKTIKKPYKD